VQDHRRAVGRDFDDVIGGIGMRLGEVSDDHFVDAPLVSVWSRATRPRVFFYGVNLWIRGRLLAGQSPAITWLYNLSEHRSTGLEIVFQAQHGSGNAARFGSGEPDYANPAATGRGGDGDDRVVKVHGEIVAAERSRE